MMGRRCRLVHCPPGKCGEAFVLRSICGRHVSAALCAFALFNNFTFNLMILLPGHLGTHSLDRGFVVHTTCWPDCRKR